MSSGHQRIKWRRNIAENFNRLSRVHERYRQTDDKQTDGRRHIANMNMSSRSLKTFRSKPLNFSGAFEKHPKLNPNLGGHGSPVYRGIPLRTMVMPH